MIRTDSRGMDRATETNQRICNGRDAFSRKGLNSNSYKTNIKIVIVVLFVILSNPIFGQEKSTASDTVVNYFTETRLSTKKNEKLWNVDLYGPILFVRAKDRMIYANFPDSEKVLKQNGQIYTGYLPKEVNISAASINWNGMTWVILPYPLPATLSKQDIVGLICHELFHSAQSSLGFAKVDEQINDHLDEKIGRMYLRLELEALKQALQTVKAGDRKKHISNALAFRNYRYILYPRAKQLENEIELKEGIAEYTGIVLSGRNKKQIHELLVSRIESFSTNSTFVRIFPYYTIPVYGYLLRDSNKFWNQEISSKSILADYFVNAFHAAIKHPTEQSIAALGNLYGAEAIVKEEDLKLLNARKQVEAFNKTLIEDPHLEISLTRLNMSFNPSNIVPLGENGVVYRADVSMSDKWGVLTISKGGLLINTDKNKLSITLPLKFDDRNVSGDGWTLKLNEGFTIIKDENSMNYKLVAF